MVGTEFDIIFLNKIDESYSGYTNPAKKKRLFKEALILAIEEKYRQLDTQKEYDELSPVIKTEKTFTPTSNAIFTKGTTTPVISDYEHLLAVKSKYLINTNLTITDASRETPIVITVAEQNNLRSGEQLIIENIIGNTYANQAWYIKKISSKKFALYADKDLIIPVVSNAQYISGGTIKRIYYNYCKPYVSDRKIAIYGKPSVTNPKFDTSNNQIKFYPAEETTTEITIDYITKATVFIDPQNNTIDLEKTYSYKFLLYIINIAAKLVAAMLRDKELLQTSAMSIKEDNL
ncbi:hypothetical protein LCGC14_2499310 [marine sediment metagenome]|uniref:DUF4815 domain-containing protein n=1 Tax=marine sediment metagenome TaxID=412755 RepID=A0A0F9DE60_9ZZZZ